ncbi:hypothetical protein GCM10020358_67060 [Amorphoplanes nipponensis]
MQERTILMLVRHEHIVGVRDLFSAGESLGLVMDFVAGGSLRERLRSAGTLAGAEAARLLAQVAAALAEAHALAWCTATSSRTTSCCRPSTGAPTLGSPTSASPGSSTRPGSPRRTPSSARRTTWPRR